MGLIGFIALIFLLLCAGAAIVLTVVSLPVIFGLISAGILSASVIIWLNKRSYESGFKTFIFSSACIFGILSGIVFFCFSEQNQSLVAYERSSADWEYEWFGRRISDQFTYVLYRPEIVIIF